MEARKSHVAPGELRGFALSELVTPVPHELNVPSCDRPSPHPELSQTTVPERILAMRA